MKKQGNQIFGLELSGVVRGQKVLLVFFYSNNQVSIKSEEQIKTGLPTWLRSQCNTSKKINKYIFIGMHKKFLPQYST